MTNERRESLVAELFEGPIDIIGDVHGDISALKMLLGHLGYNALGDHAESRRLVFVGDLVDRGPDSPAVVRQVRNLIETGRAQCVLGNHELNIMLMERKFDNGWFFGEAFIDPVTNSVVPQVRADENVRTEIVEFFNSLPVALERDDVRVVHACWQPEMVSMLSAVHDVVEYHDQHGFNISLGLAIRSDLEDWQREQRHQNLNPVKVLTSGLEVKADKPFEASGKTRQLQRYPWWNDYQDEAYCFFGHYSHPFGVDRGQTRAICVDYGVARRWVPKEPGDNSPSKWRLAAVRYPEMQVYFDNGDRESLDC